MTPIDTPRGPGEIVSETRLIIAMDMTDRENALAVAEEVKDYIDAFKVNYPIVLACGIEIVTELAKLAPVICDFKVADIGNTNRLIVEQAKQAGACGIIVHAFPGEDAIMECVKAAGDDMAVYVVAEMSHPGGSQWIGPVADVLARRAVLNGAKGIIAPGNNPRRIARMRTIVGPDSLILSPGIGAQGGNAKEAIDAGADFVIVGRAIYEAASPREAALEITEQIRGK